ncbi:MAG: hypothetical protein J6C23_02680 [Clostridia bacterium]|nr:hypothetical protein [Clostridia bacterium]MBO5223400.1 hypothetical protein [Clostridia bacterium]
MTEQELKFLRFQIARVQGTLPCNVEIERSETLTGTQLRNVYAKVKAYRVGVLTDGTRILQSWRVI